MIPKTGEKQTTFVRLFLLVNFAVLFTALLVGNHVMKQEEELKDRIYPNVNIDNTDVGRKTKEELTGMYEKKNTELENLHVSVIYKDEVVASFSAKQAGIKSNGKEIIERGYLIGRSSHGPSSLHQKLVTLFNLGDYHFTTAIEYDKDFLAQFIENLEEKYNKPARNALFSFEDGKVISFRQEEKGLKLDTEKLIEDVSKNLQTWKTIPKNQRVKMTGSIIEPEVTLKNSNKYGIEELIGEGQSNFTHSIPERIHNLTLATSKFHGVLIPKGKVFSFNDLVGDISSLTGYKPAYIIKNGRTVLGDGGGICQVSTTLFRAALNSGLPIVERYAHAYRVLYYENDAKPGLDATVFSPSVDFKFKNDTSAHILVQTEVDGENNLLYFRFYGKKDDRKVELSDIKVFDQSPPPEPLYEDDPTLKRGITKQVDFPAWGGKSTYSYKVKRGEKILFEKEFLSVYRPWRAVFLVGTAD